MRGRDAQAHHCWGQAAPPPHGLLLVFAQAATWSYVEAALRARVTSSVGAQSHRENALSLLRLGIAFSMRSGRKRLQGTSRSSGLHLLKRIHFAGCESLLVLLHTQ